MGSHVTITSKGQMTIPKHLREQLNVKPGDKCYAWVRDGEMIIVPRNRPLSELAGVLGEPPSRAVAADQTMDEAVMDEAVERFRHAAGGDV
ncbi:AbrB family looped-hinge helix DNA binding protein [Neorhizobium galegae]|uniref:AbrB/MazE/SpoVT family DNA-binding domain-containing protein n=1 Tax=Neorhizobium galegae TaxID=399 RepID=UPI001AEAC8E0|nr:AbrB/MazE/SpoVT family DNA-binding domain-containing protein [Neorhizobium galegae]MBP2548597.1 AbrB family looped-hinge helix DNA binding protein [Neorhizobium galegae]